MTIITFPSVVLKAWFAKYEWRLDRFEDGYMIFNAIDLTPIYYVGKEDYEYFLKLVNIHNENLLLGMSDEDYNEQIREAIDQGETTHWLKER